MPFNNFNISESGGNLVLTTSQMTLEGCIAPMAEAPAEIVETDIEVPQAQHATWEGPITFEGIYTGDKRFFNVGSVTWNEGNLPFVFKWQRVSSEGHDASIAIGRVDSIFRGGEGAIWGRGVILTGDNAPPEAAQYLALLAEGAAGGVSIDGDDYVMEVFYDEDLEGNITDMRRIFSRINLRALTAVDIPAFAGAKIKLVDAVMVADSYIREIKSRGWESEMAETLVASIPVNPPSEWFETPKFSELTPLTFTEDGKVFGHLCGKETCHIGYGTCKTSPRGCDYDAYFHLGSIPTAEGGTVNVGHMTFGAGHSDINLGAQAAASAYDSTSRVSADIRCGEDEFGTWVAGALRPTLSPEDLREIMSAPLSGDWRPIKGQLQLIAAHAVNVPGFPIPRAKVMVASGVTETIIITEDCGCDLSEEFVSLMFQFDIEEEN